uniref:GM04403p n=1 Tax=Drosophila melanogaster TaxID=7227 RepID=Q8T950_DROME|nr:GM04403p [Drosophila melanogaster]
MLCRCHTPVGHKLHAARLNEPLAKGWRWICILLSWSCNHFRPARICGLIFPAHNYAVLCVWPAVLFSFVLWAGQKKKIHFSF